MPSSMSIKKMKEEQKLRLSPFKTFFSGKMQSLVVPENAEFSSFKGIVVAQGREYTFRLSNVDYGRENGLMESVVVMEEPLRELLEDRLNTINKRLHVSKSVDDFLQDVTNAVDMKLRANPPPVLLPTSYYSRMLGEMDSIGWNYLLSLNDSMDRVQLVVQDGARRDHILTVLLQKERMDCIADLPVPFRLQCQNVSHSTSLRSKESYGKESKDASQWSANFSLRHAVDEFKKELEKYQLFWDLVDDLDRNTWILEPEHPSRGTTWRRIAVQKYVSIQIDVHPLSPTEICDIQFFGREEDVRKLRDCMNSNATLWDSTLGASLQENLEMLLEVSLPTPQTSSKEEFAVECGICYNYRLSLDSNNAGGAKGTETVVLPDRTCENTKCGRPFHVQCLLEWLRSVPNHKQSFNIIFGNCPYCQEVISARNG